MEAPYVEEGSKEPARHTDTYCYKSPEDATHSKMEKNNTFTEAVTLHNIDHLENTYLHANNTNITEGGIYS